MTDEQLIRDAGRAILRAHDRHPQPGEDGFDNDAVAWAEALGRAALAVFEKAHTPNTPTDDERKQLDEIMAEAYGYWPPARALILERFRRSEPQGEPSDLVRRLIDLRGDMRHNADEVATLDAAIAAIRAQGEPSDAQVEAALQALGHARSGVTPPTMRAALRAASEAGGEGR